MSGVVPAYDLSDLVDLERSAGKEFGPFHRQWLQERAPERVRHYLDLAAKRPDIVCANSPFTSIDGNIVPTVSNTAVTASATETNLWTPSLWSPIPAQDMRAGKVYQLAFGGVFTSTATPGVLTWTPRAGQSATPASNVTLGASNATAPPASLTAQGWVGQFTLVVRSVDAAYTAVNATGNGFVIVQGAAAATATMYQMGGTVATTINNSVASGLIVSLTISVASQSYTCQWVALQTLN